MGPKDEQAADKKNGLPSREIRSLDLTLSILGFGGLQVGDYWVRMPEEEAYAAIKLAHDSGIRYYDTAPHYGTGLSEHRIGHVLRGLPRNGFVLSTKVGRYLVADEKHAEFDPDFRGLPFGKIYDLSYDATMRAYDQSLQRLGLNRIDLLFIHDLDTYQHGDEYDARFKEGIDGCYRALDELRSQKAVRGIGAGLNTAEAAVRLIEATDLDCLMLAGRYTLLEQGPAEDLLPLALRREVSLVMGAPFNTGILATGAVEGALYNNRPVPPEIAGRVRKIEEICRQFGIPIAAAALQFPLGNPIVASVVPGMGGIGDVKNNLRLMTMPIPVEFWSSLRSEGLISDAVQTSDGPLASTA